MANLLTSLRLLLIVPLVLMILREAPGWLLLLTLAVAVLSDYFDGIVARARGTASAAGQLFDHGTDFLFVTAGMFTLASQGLLTLLLPVLVVLAFSQYVLDSRLLYRQKQLRMSFLGRWNGILYFVPLFLFAGARLPLPASLSEWLTGALNWLGWLLLLSTLASIADRAVAPWRLARQS